MSVTFILILFADLSPLSMCETVYMPHDDVDDVYLNTGGENVSDKSNTNDSSDNDSWCVKGSRSGCDNEPNKMEIKLEVEDKVNVRIGSIIKNVILNGFV